MGSYLAPGSKPSDLRKFSPPRRHNQLATSSCVANAMTRALENKRIQQLYHDALAAGMRDQDALAKAQAGHISLSRLALYYLSREEMDPQETDKDEGTIVSIAAELLRTFGVSREEPDPSNPSVASRRTFSASSLRVNGPSDTVAWVSSSTAGPTAGTPTKPTSPATSPGRSSRSSQETVQKER